MCLNVTRTSRSLVRSIKTHIHTRRFNDRCVFLDTSTRERTMIVGIMQVELAIDWAQSLKDKRSVVRSLKDSLHKHHQVSVAEIEDLDIHNRAVLGITLASNSGGHIGNVLDRVLSRIRSVPDAEVISNNREILHGWIGSSRTQAQHEEDLNDPEFVSSIISRGNSLGTEETEDEQTAEHRSMNGSTYRSDSRSTHRSTGITETNA